MTRDDQGKIVKEIIQNLLMSTSVLGPNYFRRSSAPKQPAARETDIGPGARHG